MSLADRVHTTPVQIHDAIETQIPFRYRAEIITIFADLASNAPIIRENAITRGHAVASQLKAIAESQTIPGQYTDAEPSACLKVANYLYAAMDDARQRAPSPYPSGSVNDAATVTDRDSAYAAMIEHNRNAWKGPAAQTSTSPTNDGTPSQLGDRATAYEQMIERDRNAWEGAQK
jgi:hypothetical protein